MLTQPQKAAAIIAALSQEQAANLLKHFSSQEVRALMQASEALEHVSETLLRDITEEFTSKVAEQAGPFAGRNDFHSFIEGALTPEQLAALSEGPDAAKMALKKKSIWELLESIDNEQLMTFIQSESPFIAAHVLTRLASKKSAEIIGELENANREQIVAAMITTRPVVSDASAMVEELITEHFARLIGKSGGAGTQKLVAGMLNELAPEVSDELLERLSGVVEAQSLQSVKSMMFRFGDIAGLEPAARSTLFDQVPTEVTTLALRDADEQTIEMVLSSLGQRTRRMLESELKTESPASAEDIKGAKKEIASTVLRLSGEGLLNIPQPDLAA